MEHNLAISVIVGATLQILLFVTPFLVVVGWITGKPMSLQFDTFQTIVLTLSTLVVDCIVHDGSTNYCEGLLLVATYVLSVCHFDNVDFADGISCSYVIIGIAFFVHPEDGAAAVG
jgi:Ca2+:H+ antiporter